MMPALLCHKDTEKEIPLVGGFGCLELCLYNIRELALISDLEWTSLLHLLHSQPDHQTTLPHLSCFAKSPGEIVKKTKATLTEDISKTSLTSVSKACQRNKKLQYKIVPIVKCKLFTWSGIEKWCIPNYNF